MAAVEAMAEAARGVIKENLVALLFLCDLTGSSITDKSNF
jgi:hypothetical protein